MFVRFIEYANLLRVSRRRSGIATAAHPELLDCIPVAGEAGFMRRFAIIKPKNAIAKTIFFPLSATS